MGNLTWYVNRLKAMSIQEVCWRISQKRLEREEKYIFGKTPKVVTINVFDKHIKSLTFNTHNIGINFSNTSFSTQTNINLLGNYSYKEYKEKWNAGFQTENNWGNEYSYSLNYKQKDNIGDARTNWELNRHFQFALLAKAFFATGNKIYINELEHLFTDWNKNNLFLHGISWTSVMEVAIRNIQWCLTLSFLREKEINGNKKLLFELDCGIKNMTTHIVRHYSRFSSANNHLLVEATSIAYAGFAYQNEKWINLAISLLNNELKKQNYSDGVNKEMALHYQTFGMEAYALVMMLMRKNNKPIPSSWNEMLAKQCEFVKHSMVNESNACEFGDNDEGKIIDLEGGEICHYRYILQLCSLILGIRYDNFDNISETIKWFYTEDEIKKCKGLPIYHANESRTFPDGGYSILKSNDGEIIIGIDHAPLGFGSIAAHGHADALSFQLYVSGKCILGDPGTFIYHCNINKRNEYRKSNNHNTVWVNNEEQSQMMGAFLWGKKAKTKILNNYLGANNDIIEAECVWHNGYKHKRSFQFDKKKILQIEDNLLANEQGYASLIIHPCCHVSTNKDEVIINNSNVSVKITTNAIPNISSSWYSDKYGVEKKCKKITYKLNNNKLNTTIWIEKC